MNKWDATNKQKTQCVVAPFGLSGAPFRVGWAHLAVPQAERTTKRSRCVSCWSATGQWQSIDALCASGTASATPGPERAPPKTLAPESFDRLFSWPSRQSVGAAPDQQVALVSTRQHFSFRWTCGEREKRRICFRPWMPLSWFAQFWLFSSTSIPWALDSSMTTGLSFSPSLAFLKKISQLLMELNQRHPAARSPICRASATQLKDSTIASRTHFHSAAIFSTISRTTQIRWNHSSGRNPPE